MKLLRPHGASLSGEAITASGPRAAEGRGPYQNCSRSSGGKVAAAATWKERARNTGLSVSFLLPPRLLPWLPQAEPSTQQGSASLDVESGWGEWVWRGSRIQCRKSHQDLWVSTVEFTLESPELISLHDRPRKWGEGCYHGETSRKMGLGC